MPAEAALPRAPIETERRLCFCDAAKMAVGLGATALPFAGSHSEEAERWLRVLRMSGAVGEALQGLGVPEHPLVASANPSDAQPREPDAVGTVIEAATHSARARDADAVTTGDLFQGVAATYGPAFDHALAIRGTTSAEVIERLARPPVR
jgi:hypothetical protein